jgi:hypothetical protein
MVYYLGHVVHICADPYVLHRSMLYYLDHAVHICAESHKKMYVLRRNMMYFWATLYISAQNPIKDVRTAQEHGVLPAPGGTYLSRTP